MLCKTVGPPLVLLGMLKVGAALLVGACPRKAAACREGATELAQSFPAPRAPACIPTGALDLRPPPG